MSIAEKSSPNGLVFVTLFAFSVFLAAQLTVGQDNLHEPTEFSEIERQRLLNTFGLDIASPQQLLHNKTLLGYLSVTPAQIERLNDLEKAYWEDTAKMMNKAFEEGLEPGDITSDMHAFIHQRRTQAQEKLLDDSKRPMNRIWKAG